MKETSWRVAWLFSVLGIALLCSACAGGGGEGDAGASDADAHVEDGADADSDADSDADGTSLTDVDLGDAYGLLVPTGFQACSQAGYLWSEDLPDVLRLFARVTFKPGLFRLDKDLTSFEADLIEQVEWSREPQIATPTGPGQFTREDERYTYIQDFVFGQEQVRIEMRVSFGPNGDTDPGQVIELNEAHLVGYRVSLGALVGVTNLYFSACTCDTFTHRVVDYTFDDGDLLSIEVCSFCADYCKNSTGRIPRADVTFSGESRTLSDQMQLAIVFGQHDWYGTALVYLREPLAGYAGLVLTFGNMLEGGTVDLFDESLQVIQTKNVTQTEIRPAW